MATKDRWLGGQPLPNLTDGSALAGSQQWWGQGQPAPGLDSDAVAVIDPATASLLLQGQPCTVNEVLFYPATGAISATGNTAGFVHVPFLLISQLGIEASSTKPSSGLQLWVSQLAAEASNYASTVEVRASYLSIQATSKDTPVTFYPSPGGLTAVGGQIPQEFSPAEVVLALVGNASPDLFVTLPLWPQPGSFHLSGNALGSLMVYQWAIPIADVAKGSFVPSTGVDLYPCVNDYETPDDSTYIEATVPTEATLQLSGLNEMGAGDTAEMVIRLKRD
jgi:hypothetical protein